jgi:hypothetical protein
VAQRPIGDDGVAIEKLLADLRADGVYADHG